MVNLLPTRKNKPHKSTTTGKKTGLLSNGKTMNMGAFSKANQLFRKNKMEEAIDRYCDAVNEHPTFYWIYFNLSMAINKSNVEGSKLNKILFKIVNDIEGFDQNYDLIRKSQSLNGKRYLEEYASDVPEGTDPILHYLTLGWRLGFNPSNFFNTNSYLESHRAQIYSNEVPLLHFLKGRPRDSSVKVRKLNTASHYAAQLWNGHSATALKGLEKIYQDNSVSEGVRWSACWNSAQWFYCSGEFEKALILVNKMQQLLLSKEPSKETLYLEFFCLLALDRSSEACTILENYIQQHPEDLDALFASANAVNKDEKRIDLINNAFAAKGFSGVRRKNENAPLALGNLVGLTVAKVKSSKKVSIIMPIYNSGNRVRVAIESLLAQSYKNIEIIAVDDCSHDDTFSALKALEKEDPRVKAVQTLQNGGAYAARNYGLRFATGEFITTHDSDDWSHPQKLEVQVAYLEKHPDIKGCSAYWIRTKGNLFFAQNWRPSNRLIHWSRSSFMFRRGVLEAIGEWDHVRIAGDSEFICRMQAWFGKKSFAKIYPDTPLAFALDEGSSLTRTKATHVHTVYFGLRHIYREIFSWWHATYRHLNVPDAKTRRPFPAPRSMFERSDEPLEFNTVIAGDFSNFEDCQKAAEYIDGNRPRKIALFHWPGFHKFPESLCNLYFVLLQQDNVEPVVMGQKIISEFYFITDIKLLENSLDGYPEMLRFEEWKKFIL